MKKYELTRETMETEHGAVYRIRALKDLPKANVKAGDYGGWISGEHNLSQDGECWASDNAVVCEGAKVYNDAQVCDSALIYGSAHVFGNARVFGNALVYGNASVLANARVSNHAKVFDKAWASGNASVNGEARVYGSAEVYDRAWVFGDAQVYENATVCGAAFVYGSARVYGCAFVHASVHLSSETRVFGYARIEESKDIQIVEPVGLVKEIATAYKDAKIGVRVVFGDFTGSLDEFAAKIREISGERLVMLVYERIFALGDRDVFTL
jgi:UDP-3-O-[3-hydroxymyristoyl] glucosamine N-acyltransferase